MQVEDQKPGSARNVKGDSAAKGRVSTTAAHVSDAQSNARSLTAVRDGSFLQYRRRQDEKETRGKSGVMLSPARGVETNRPIDWFDIQVMAAVRSIGKTEGLKSLIPGAPEGIVFTPLSVFRTLTDPAADPRRGSAILEDIEESIDTLSGISSKYNVREELTRRGVDPGIIETFDVVQYLLPTEYIEVRIHGVACRTYQTRGTPSLFIYQDAIGQECAIDPSVRSIQKVDGNGRLLYKANKAGGEVPALISLSSRTRLAILGYLEMRVAVYKNDVRRFFEECRKAETQKAEGRKHVSTPGPVKQANKILAETLCEMCGLSAHNLQRDLAFVEDVFRYWKATGHIDGFEMRYKAQGARGQSLECVKFKWAPITE